MRGLLDYLPRFYPEGPEVRAIQEAVEPEVRALALARDDLFAQLNVDTATWGLSEWEKMLALEVNAQRPMEDRRNRIRSKLRVQGVTTPELLRNVAEAFSDGPVTVTEFFSEYRVEIWLVLSMARPAGDLPALWRQIAEARPAHLGFLLCVRVPPTWVEEAQGAELERFLVNARSYERGNRVNRLDGVRRLDGSWVLDGVDEYRPALESVGFGLSVWQPMNSTAAVTVDSMWRLDGAWPLDGYRKLDAEIVRREFG